MLTLYLGDRVVTGRCVGIAPDGALILDTPEGRQQFYAGTLRPPQRPRSARSGIRENPAAHCHPEFSRTELQPGEVSAFAGFFRGDSPCVAGHRGEAKIVAIVMQLARFDLP